MTYIHVSGVAAAGFFVNISGDIMASGIPKRVPTLANARAAQEKLVAEAAAFIQPNVTYSNLIATLGPPELRSVTSNGVVAVAYTFGLPYGTGTNGFWVYLSTYLGSSLILSTNGFSENLSNYVVIGKVPILGRGESAR